MKKQWVTFTEDRVVQDQYAGTKKETAFKRGKSYELDEPSALRWILRGVAISGNPKARQPAEVAATPGEDPASIARATPDAMSGSSDAKAAAKPKA